WPFLRRAMQGLREVHTAHRSCWDSGEFGNDVLAEEFQLLKCGLPGREALREQLPAEVLQISVAVATGDGLHLALDVVGSSADDQTVLPQPLEQLPRTAKIERECGIVLWSTEPLGKPETGQILSEDVADAVHAELVGFLKGLAEHHTSSDSDAVAQRQVTAVLGGDAPVLLAELQQPVRLGHQDERDDSAGR